MQQTTHIALVTMETAFVSGLAPAKRIWKTIPVTFDERTIRLMS